jgi:hypothetical protein
MALFVSNCATPYVGDINRLYVNPLLCRGESTFAHSLVNLFSPHLPAYGDWGVVSY